MRPSSTPFCSERGRVWGISNAGVALVSPPHQAANRMASFACSILGTAASTQGRGPTKRASESLIGRGRCQEILLHSRIALLMLGLKSAYGGSSCFQINRLGLSPGPPLPAESHGPGLVTLALHSACRQICGTPSLPDKNAVKPKQLLSSARPSTGPHPAQVGCPQINVTCKHFAWQRVTLNPQRHLPEQKAHSCCHSESGR